MTPSARPLPLDERELVERARSDPDAFVALYRSYVERIHAFAWRRCGTREAAEDITSATFERAWRSMAGFEWRDGGFGAWLFRIAASQVADYHRREARPRSDRGQRALSLLLPEPLDGPVDRDDGSDLRAALDRLHPRYAEVLSLRFLAGLDHGEVAEALSVSKATLAVVVHRALAALRRELAKGEGGHDRT